jgi:prepilin-type N-terminal cleavage/methylation domain-containing protein
MKNRKGFTLAEMVLALFIFGFMSMSLATIYATANRHMFQNYRRNIIKTNADFAMKLLHNTLTTATRIDWPVYGASGTVLAFASNVDQTTGRYPLNTAAAADWHYFCVAPDDQDPTVIALYYHTGRLSNGAGGVPSTNALNPAAPVFTTASYPACGPGGGGVVTKLMQHLAIPPSPVEVQNPFSRAAADGVREVPAVRVRLHSFWRADTRGFGNSQRDIDFFLDSVLTVNRTSQ